MGSIEKYSTTNYIIRLHVKTNSKNQKIIKNGDNLTIFLKSKPVQNKANIELLSFIKNKLNISSNQIKIISGSRSRDKAIKITLKKNGDKEEIIKKLLI
ncbi:MAG: DUF167 domain-containing protein [Candidatus Lokiarchaeota archaeon]|nr:DUF167 domain-containing protein [Candidatus Lokiarchaeota archaeon]